MEKDTVLSVRFSPDQIRKLDHLAAVAHVKRGHVIKALLATARLVTVVAVDEGQAGRLPKRAKNSGSGADDPSTTLLTA